MRIFQLILILMTASFAYGAPVPVSIENIDAPTTLDFFGGAALENGDLIASGDGGTIFRHRNGQWEEFYTPRFPSSTLTVRPMGDDRFYTFVWGFSQYFYDGTALSQRFDFFAQHAFDASFLSETEYSAASIQGTVVHYKNGSFTKEPDLDRMMLRAIDHDPDGRLYVGGLYGAFFVKESGSWTRINDLDEEFCVAGLVATGPREVWMVGWHGTLEGRIYRWRAGVLEDFTPAGAKPLYRIRSGPNGTLWAVGVAGQLYRFANGAWEQWDTQTLDNLHEVQPMAEDNAYVFGALGTVRRMSLGGGNPTPTPMATFTPQPNGRILAAGYMGTDATAASGGLLEILAITDQADAISVSYAGTPLGVSLAASGDGAFALPGAPLGPSAGPQQFLLELVPNSGPSWPYLVVEQ